MIPVRYQHNNGTSLLLVVVMTSLALAIAQPQSQSSLLIATGDGIQQISLDGHNTTQHLLQGSRTSCVDSDFQTNTMFWSSYIDHKMYTGKISEGAANKSIVVHDPYSNIYAIGYDWIYGNVYWTDNDKDELCVSTKNGTFKKVLFNDGISLPSSIVVNPLNGWMHWADTIFNRIERAAMDGTKREVILSTDVRYPSALTIDFTQNRIYWTQNDPFSISSSNFDGSDRKIIYTGNQQESSAKRFKAIATFQDSVYWIESNSRTVYRANRDDGENFVRLFKYNSTLYDIKVYDASRQLNGENLCTKRIQQCSHFCFPVPVSSGLDSSAAGAGNFVSTSCGCPNGLNLSAADGRNCI